LIKQSNYLNSQKVSKWSETAYVHLPLATIRLHTGSLSKRREEEIWIILGGDEELFI